MILIPIWLFCVLALSVPLYQIFHRVWDTLDGFIKDRNSKKNKIGF